MKPIAVAFVLAISMAASSEACGFVPEPMDFRGEPYRAPVPATLAGALVIGDEAARALWHSGRVAFVDVMPRAPKPAGLPEGTLWRNPPHQSIPGAIWLPNTGYESLGADEVKMLELGLSRATGGDRSAPVVVFCMDECWMSWNAARRAVEAGYSRVFWYPRGTDGWAAEGWPLDPVIPYEP